MKKLLLFALCMCFLTPSQAFSGAYVAPKIIGNIVSTPEMLTNIENAGVVKKTSSDFHDDTLFSGALAIGYNFNSTYNIPVRAELEYSFFSQFSSRSGVLNLEVSIQTVLINTYYDFHNASKFTPYVGLGLGLAFLGVSGDVPYGDVFDKNTQTNFAWNIGVGSSYAVTDTISFDFAYRYAQFGKCETKKVVISANRVAWRSTDTISAHQVMLGVRYTF